MKITAKIDGNAKQALEDLIEHIETIEKNLEDTANELADAEGENDNLRCDIVHAENFHRETRQDLDLAEKEIERLRAKIEQLETETAMDRVKRAAGAVVLDQYTQDYTAFNSFQDFVDARYNPTLATQGTAKHNQEMNILGIAFDCYMAETKQNYRILARY